MLLLLLLLLFIILVFIIIIDFFLLYIYIYAIFFAMFPFLDPQISSQAAGPQDPIHVGELLLLGAVWKIQVSHIDMVGFGKQPTFFFGEMST